MQDYKMLLRAVHAGADIKFGSDTVLYNALGVRDYLNEVYLSNGYRIVSVDYLGEFIVDPDNPKASPQGPRFAWHLVKEFEPTPTKKPDNVK